MFDDRFRARFAPLLTPIAHALARLGVTPNHVTLATFVLAIGAAVSIANGYTHAGLALWIVSRLGDGLDGAIARVAGLKTPFGGYLDITLDMAGYSAMVLGFAALHPALGLAWAAVLAGYVIAITTTLALSGAADAMARQVGRGDRTFQFTPGVTEAGETNVMYALWVMLPQYIEVLVWIWVAALAATGLQRSYLAWRALR